MQTNEKSKGRSKPKFRKCQKLRALEPDLGVGLSFDPTTPVLTKMGINNFNSIKNVATSEAKSIELDVKIIRLK